MTEDETRDEMSSGSTPPGSTIEAAFNAAKRALSFTPLKLGTIVRDRDAAAHPVPDDDPRAVVLTLSGIVEGTVHIAIGDEYLERLEYTSKTDSVIVALAGTIEAIMGALHPLGDITVGETTEEDLDAWPGADGTTLIMSAPLMDKDEVVAQIAFALSYHAVTPGSPQRDDRERIEVPTSPVSPLGSAAPGGVAARAAGPRPDAGTFDEVAAREIARLAGVEVELSAVLGRAILPMHELLTWLPGSIVTLDRMAGTPADLCIGETVVACGDVVVVDENFGIRITEVTMQGPSAHSMGLSRP
jgi:flagellar motor switch protein FliN/FliY